MDCIDGGERTQPSRTTSSQSARLPHAGGLFRLEQIVDGDHDIEPPRRCTHPGPVQRTGCSALKGDPVNRTDPNSTVSLGTVLDAVGKGGDAIAAGPFVGQLITGDYKAATGTAISFAADKAFAAGCTYLTGGAGAIPCAVGGMAVGKATEAAYNDTLCLRRRRHHAINSRIDCNRLQGT
ncbi:hypothetical protein ACFYQQ_14795 [Streptomyces sp. NPDC005496]|uniref:hypothetical protein n=1 Tax=unclassified Streptomyces TaxID=2593676 RepID=UPI0033A1AD44